MTPYLKRWLKLNNINPYNSTAIFDEARMQLGKTFGNFMLLIIAAAVFMCAAQWMYKHEKINLALFQKLIWIGNLWVLTWSAGMYSVFVIGI